MTSTTGRTGLGFVLVAMALAACVPLTTVPVTPTASPSPAASLAFTTGALQLQTGDGKSLAQLLTLSGQPVDAVTLGLLVFQVSNPGVASVGADGTIKGLAAGSTTVTAVNKLDPALRAQLDVNVVANGSAVQIVIKPESATVGIGEGLPLVAEVHLATGAVNANVDWSSSDDTIATVNRTTGVVTGLKEGRVTIRATYTQDNADQQVADLRVVKDKTQAEPSAAPSVVVFGGSPTPTPVPGAATPTPAPLGTWTKLTSGVTENLSGVHFLDARTGFVMGEGGLLLKTTNGAKWTSSYPVSLGFQAVQDFDFGSPTTGIAVIGGKPYRTADGGDTWEGVAAPTTGVHFVRFSSATDVDLVSGSDHYQSTDGGKTFVKQEQPATCVARFGSRLWLANGTKLLRDVPDLGWVGIQTPITIGDMKFFSESVGYLRGSQGGASLLAVTADGGKTVNPLPASQADASDFADAQHGLYIAHTLGGYNYRNERVNESFIQGTVDGGATWRNTTLTGATDTLGAISYPTATTAYAVGRGGQIFKFEATP